MSTSSSLYTDIVEKKGRKMKKFSAFIVEKGTPGFTFGTKGE
jgi:butyryl-CoA dehydrogenase